MHVPRQTYVTPCTASVRSGPIPEALWVEIDWIQLVSVPRKCLIADAYALAPAFTISSVALILSVSLIKCPVRQLWVSGLGHVQGEGGVRMAGPGWGCRQGVCSFNQAGSGPEPHLPPVFDFEGFPGPELRDCTHFLAALLGSHDPLLCKYMTHPHFILFYL